MYHIILMALFDVYLILQFANLPLTCLKKYDKQNSYILEIGIFSKLSSHFCNCNNIKTPLLFINNYLKINTLRHRRMCHLPRSHLLERVFLFRNRYSERGGPVGQVRQDSILPQPFSTMNGLNQGRILASILFMLLQT